MTTQWLGAFTLEELNAIEEVRRRVFHRFAADTRQPTEDQVPALLEAYRAMIAVWNEIASRVKD